MPTYDYECEKCDHSFEEFQSMSSDVLVDCPECGKPSLRRLIGTGAGLIFKGSGFYETDYKNVKSDEGSSSSDSGSKESSESSSSDASNKSETKKSETKPVKKESKPKAETKKASKAKE